VNRSRSRASWTEIDLDDDDDDDARRPATKTETETESSRANASDVDDVGLGCRDRDRDCDCDCDDDGRVENENESANANANANARAAKTISPVVFRPNCILVRTPPLVVFRRRDHPHLRVVHAHTGRPWTPTLSATSRVSRIAAARLRLVLFPQSPARALSRRRTRVDHRARHLFARTARPNPSRDLSPTLVRLVPRRRRRVRARARTAPADHRSRHRPSPARLDLVPPRSRIRRPP